MRIESLARLQANNRLSLIVTFWQREYNVAGCTFAVVCFFVNVERPHMLHAKGHPTFTKKLFGASNLPAFTRSRNLAWCHLGGQLLDLSAFSGLADQLIEDRTDDAADNRTDNVHP